MKDIVDTAKNTTKEVISSSWIEYFIRIGYLIRGMLYIIVGTAGLLFDLGIVDTTLNTSEVILMISHWYFGTILLILLIIGLAGYSIWGAIRSIVPHIKIANRFGYIVSAISYFILLNLAIKVLLYLPAQNSTSIKTASDTILHFPFGPQLLLIIGVLSICGSLFQIIKALRSKYATDFWGIEEIDEKKHYRRLFVLLAKTGIIIRAIIFGLIGFFICKAALHFNSSEVKSIDGIFWYFKNLLGGSFWIGLISIGLIFFGIYSSLLSILVNLFIIKRYDTK